MASADCVTSIGAWSYATPTKNGAGDCLTRAGINSAAARVAWGGSASPREKLDWLPRADEVWIDPKTGRPSRRFYQFLREIAEVRLGGVQGKSVPQVQTDVVNTQAEVAATTTFAAQVNQYAQGVAAVAAATTAVAQDSGLAGSESIPEVPPAPTRPRVDPYDL